MIGTFRMEDVDKMQATITLTAGVGEWRVIRCKLSDLKWPESDLARVLDDVISKAEKTFYANGKSP